MVGEKPIDMLGDDDDSEKGLDAIHTRFRATNDGRCTR